MTASAAAALRAAHLLFDEDPKIFEDPVALRLLDPYWQKAVNERSERLLSPDLAAIRTQVLVRSRYTEECLEKAHAEGAQQYVILGAGLDSFALRRPPWAHGLSIFEVDRLASQQWKRERLEAAGISPPGNLVAVPHDLASGSLLERLAASGFDRGTPTFFACLGVLSYLDRDATRSLVAELAGLRSAELVFSFAPAVTDGGAGDWEAAAARAGAAGEPWRTRWVPEELAQMMRACGFSRVDLLVPAEIEQRYLRGRRDGLVVPRAPCIGRALARAPG